MIQNLSKKYIFPATLGLVFSLALASCGSKEEPPTVYFPDMYYPVAYDPLSQAKDPYSDHENEIPLFSANEGATALNSPKGTVFRTKEGFIEVNESPESPDEYNAGYNESLLQAQAPTPFTTPSEKDLARGKAMFEHTCAACHGVAGDGQGPIVVSGAYSGVPAYADRNISVGSVHYVIMNGRNAMGSYAGQLMPADRWRVANYVMNEFKKNAAPAAGATATPGTASAPTMNATASAPAATTTPTK